MLALAIELRRLLSVSSAVAMAAALWRSSAKLASAEPIGFSFFFAIDRATLLLLLLPVDS